MLDEHDCCNQESPPKTSILFWNSLTYLSIVGGKLAAGKRVVTEDDFIVNDSEEEYETASSNEESEDEIAPKEDAHLETDWVLWGEGQDVDVKLREIVKSKGRLWNSVPPLAYPEKTPSTDQGLSAVEKSQLCRLFKKCGRLLLKAF